MIPLDCGAAFEPAREEEFYAALPPRPAVFLIQPREDAGTGRAEPYLLRTADLRRRVERLLRVPAQPSKRLNLRAFAGGIRYRLTGSAFEQHVLYYQQAHTLFPRRARQMARLRPPALLKVNLSNAYPRCYVTRRIFSDGAFYFGPFHTRKAADAFAAEFLNFFRIRRCQIKILRDPTFPGCIYSEMKMCLAPCFAGCSKEEHDAEVARVVSFLATSGDSYTAELERERESASDATDFERAAALHKKLEKAAAVLRGLPEIARRVEELDAVILQRAAEDATVAIFVVRGGAIADPVPLRFAELASQPRSVEAILKDFLEPQMNPDEHRRMNTEPRTNEERRDHLSLLARWFYSKPRAGEIFFRDASRKGEWPYRKIIRACSRVIAASEPQTEPKGSSQK